MRTAFAVTAALAIGLGVSVAHAQQSSRPYYVGNPVGLPIEPPAPTAENPNPGNPWVPATDNVKMFGALYSTESCSYDPDRDLIVAPNRGVNQNIQVNDAWVALINHDGSVNTPRWIGIQNPNNREAMEPPLVLNHPFGSDIANGILYLADRDGGTPNPAGDGNLPQTAVIASFSMATGEPIGRLAIDAGAFNDIEVADDGTVYASISGNNGMIYKITPDEVATVLVPTGAPGLNSPNGVAFDPDGNLVVVMINDDGVITYDPNTGEMLKTEHAAQAGSDGLVIMPDGTKFVSSVRNGGVSMIRPGEDAVLIAENIPGAASMCYDPTANQLVVPMNANNGLAFISLDGIWAP